MAKVTVLNKNEVAALLDMPGVINAVEQAYAFKQSGLAELFPLVCHVFEECAGEMDIKSGSVDGAGIFGLKLVSAFARNAEKGLPKMMGTILVFDRETGVLKSIMDGSHITNMRTGAAGAVGCKTLARPDSQTLLMVGAGMQAYTLVAASLEVMQHIKRVLVYDPLSMETAKGFCRMFPDRLKNGFFSRYDAKYGDTLRSKAEVSIDPVEDIEQACQQADVILTATPSRQAIIMDGWVRPGTHLSCIGADMEGKQEIDEKLLARARVFADDRVQVIKVGECQKAVKQGILPPENIHEIGDVILGKIAGRQSDTQVTLLDSTGIGLQDLIVAALITDRAQKHGMGMVVEI